MEFSIGSQFSREFTFEEGRITHKLAEELNSFFIDKDYGNRIEKIYVGVICVSEGFEPFFKVRPFKVMRKEAALEYEIKLDFETFKNSDEDKRKQLLIDEFLTKTREFLTEKTINGFDEGLFLNDLGSYFNDKS